ncbi:hypothetical protein FRD01_15585 [Microvenator marinus]|uniref:Uncharacterized protein n=1 Tax=Microvenator marinus TaxID=2600177 RepID=A0A5B8XSI7_9DELT|nr:hypothetical protein [Microvenator marinus]QED28630.1 hypothetical protein FRD01_15585 [Microvenator marinus]
MRIGVIERDEQLYQGIRTNLATIGSVSRVEQGEDARGLDVVVQGDGPEVDLANTPRIEIVSQADDARLCEALRRGSAVLERPFLPERLAELVHWVARNPTVFQSWCPSTQPENFEQLQHMSLAGAEARDIAQVVSRDLGLFWTTLRLAGAISGTLSTFPTLTGAIQRIGSGRFNRLVQNGYIESLLTLSTDPVPQSTSRQMKTAECARAYLHDPVYSALAYIIPITRAVARELQIDTVELLQGVGGPKVWTQTYESLVKKELGNPVVAAIMAAEYRNTRRVQTATYHLKRAG